MGKSHATLGVAGGLVAGAAIEAPFTMKCIMAAVGAFGGLLSDADTQSSILGRLLPKFWHKLTPGHRRFTHSLFYAALVFLLAFGCQIGGARMDLWESPVTPYLPIALTAGVLSHLLADGLTEEGVPLLYPLWKHRFRLLGPFSFTTGTGTERTVVLALLSLAGGYIFLPVTRLLFGKAFDGKELLHIHVVSLLAFVAATILTGALLVAYSLSRFGKPERRKNRSERKPGGIRRGKQGTTRSKARS